MIMEGKKGKSCNNRGRRLLERGPGILLIDTIMKEVARFDYSLNVESEESKIRPRLWLFLTEERVQRVSKFWWKK